jgi:hypothetical protein
MIEENETSEFIKLVEKHSELKATFFSYYKYSFGFIIEIEGQKWEFWVGGDRDDIYRLVIEPLVTLKDLRNNITYAKKTAKKTVKFYGR